MTFKLKVGAFVDAPVRLVVRDGSRDVPFAFTLVLRRLSQDDAMALVGRLHELADEEKAAPKAAPQAVTAYTRELLADLITDWRDQRLVVDDDDRPVPYSAQALDVMLGLAGAGGVLREAALRALSDAVREQERDRRGN